MIVLHLKDVLQLINHQYINKNRGTVMKSILFLTNSKSFTLSFFLSIIFAFSNLLAQQWTGASDLNGNLYRIGRTGIGLSSTPAARLHIYEAGAGDNHSVFLSEFGSDAGRWTEHG